MSRALILLKRKKIHTGGIKNHEKKGRKISIISSPWLDLVPISFLTLNTKIMFYTKNYTEQTWKLDMKDGKLLQFNTPDRAQARIEELSNLYPNSQFSIQVTEFYGLATFCVLIR